MQSDDDARAKLPNGAHDPERLSPPHGIGSAACWSLIFHSAARMAT